MIFYENCLKICDYYIQKKSQLTQKQILNVTKKFLKCRNFSGKVPSKRHIGSFDPMFCDCHMWQLTDSNSNELSFKIAIKQYLTSLYLHHGVFFNFYKKCPF